MTAEQYVISRTVELAEIPAPTGLQDARRDLVRSWWQRDGWTDVRAAHAVGVPAIAIGVTTGGGEHTPEEWIDTAPLAVGLSCAAGTITRWERVAHEPA